MAPAADRQIAFVSHAVAVPAAPNPLSADLAVAIGLRRGLELRATLEVGNPADAERMAAELRREWDGAGPIVRSVGLPQAVVDSVDIRASASMVQVDVTATPAQLDDAIVGLVRTLGGGAMPTAGP